MHAELFKHFRNRYCRETLNEIREDNAWKAVGASWREAYLTENGDARGAEPLKFITRFVQVQQGTVALLLTHVSVGLK